MTTIAYKDGIVATDSYMTQGGQVYDNECVKRHIVDNCWFFFAGTITNKDLVIESYFNEFCLPEDVDACNSLDCLVWDRRPEVNTVREFGFNPDGKIWLFETDGRPMAIGSGNQFAIGAMDMGASAKQAVKIAIERDCFSGGKIRTYKVG